MRCHTRFRVCVCVCLHRFGRWAEALQAEQRWEVASPDGIYNAYDPLTSVYLETAFQAGRALTCLADDDGLSPSAEALGLSAVLIAPLQGDDVPPGAVYVDSRSRRRPFDKASVAFFDALVRQLGVALRNATLYQRLVDRAGRLRADVAGREAELVRLRARWEALALQPPSPVPGLVGASSAMQEVFRTLGSLEGTSVPVVVVGRRLGEQTPPWVAASRKTRPSSAHV